MKVILVGKKHVTDCAGNIEDWEPCVWHKGRQCKGYLLTIFCCRIKSVHSRTSYFRYCQLPLNKCYVDPQYLNYSLEYLSISFSKEKASYNIKNYYIKHFFQHKMLEKKYISKWTGSEFENKSKKKSRKSKFCMLVGNYALLDF